MFNHKKNEARKELILKDLKRAFDVTSKALIKGTEVEVLFWISEKPFEEYSEGQFRKRKGWIMCILSDIVVPNYLGTGFAFCSSKDEWDVNVGMTKAFVDAVEDMVYQSKKTILDEYIPKVMKLKTTPKIYNQAIPNQAIPKHDNIRIPVDSPLDPLYGNRNSFGGGLGYAPTDNNLGNTMKSDSYQELINKELIKEWAGEEKTKQVIENMIDTVLDILGLPKDETNKKTAQMGSFPGKSPNTLD